MIAPRAVFSGVVLAALLLAAGARAEPSNQDRVAAEALFKEARTLLAARKYDEACPKFAASQRLDPAVGTLLNLADCYERRGQLASAWLQLREAASLASRRGGDERRAQVAHDRAAALEPKLARMTIRAPAGVRLTRDGEALDAAVVGTPVPVDAGSHAIAARAEGKVGWETQVRVADGASVTVEVPELAPEPAAPPASAVPSAPAAPPPATAERGGSGQRVAGLVVGGAGLVALGVGVLFALDAKSKWSSVTDKCPDGRCPDDATRVAEAGAKDDAAKSATFSTIGFVAGGVLLAGGAVLYFIAPKGAADSRAVRVVPQIGPGVAGLSVGGAL